MKKRIISTAITSLFLLNGCNNETIKTVQDYELDSNKIYTGELINGVPNGKGTLVDNENNTIYTGEFKDGLYHGEGLFEWKNKSDSLEGVFENGSPISGKYTFKNTNYYEGEFNSDWKFHGQGKYDWSTYKSDGTIDKYGYLYEGEFNNGTIINCVGKLTLDRTYSNLGCQWFDGEMDAFPGIAVGQTGIGFVKYDDGSTYEGDLFVKSKTEFIRQGTGVQDFTNCTTLTSASFGASYNVKLSKYVGEFDGVSHGWIFGNGIVYFTDENGNPAGYIKGQWEGTERIGDWTGRWKKDYLLEEYSNTSELEFRPVFERRLEEFVHNHKDLDMSEKTLLLGPSWFDFWYTAKEDLAPTLDVGNFGIGGSGPIFWSENIQKLDGLKNAPKNIIYYIGANDLASRGEAIEDSILKTQIIIQGLKKLFPNTNIYICSIGPSPLRWYLVDQMLLGNELIFNLCEEENVNYFDFTTWLFDKYISNGKYYLEGYGSLKTDIWVSDNLHFNEKGYQLISSKFIEYFSN